jgi:ML domain
MFRILAPLLMASALSSVSDCSNGRALFTLTSMSFSPDPTVPGENSTLLLSMNVPTEVTNGTATYSTTYNFIPFSPTTDPLCYVTVDCPIQAGTLSTRASYPIPADLRGTMQIRITWNDMDGNLLMCVGVNTKLGMNRSKALTVFTGKTKIFLTD